ncbi:DNA-directed RNA polymerase, mitochondrial-like isoform X2 [Stegodyphus dumicola]|nr:DNA-directed RNA polymerase, mitochondrial-like isoform X2 [Stegodyphus dumicola]
MKNFMSAVSFSTVHKHKVVLNPSTSYKRHKKKLNIKPYEDLLRVLEVHECNLEIEGILSEKHNSECEQRDYERVISQELPQSLEAKCDKLSGNHRDFINDEGIFTVKYSFPNKGKKKAKKISEKNQTEYILDGKLKKQSSKKTTTKEKELTKVKQTCKKESLKKALKDAHAMHALKSYIEICINVDQIEKAQQIYEYYRQKSKLKDSTKLHDDIEIYNSLIVGWAQKGRLDKVKQIFQFMSSDNIAPNLQSYAGYLECISRREFIDVPEIQNVINEMHSKGLSHQDILQKCIFVGDQREKILEILGFVDASVAVSSNETSESYSCSLLRKLNDKAYGRGDRHPNFSFKEDDIQQISTSQMQLENDYNIRIKSVVALEEVNEKVKKSRTYLKECEDIWRKKLTISLKNLKYMKKYSSHQPSIYPYLSVIDTELLVNLLLQEIRLLAETGEFFSPNVKILYKDLGIKVMNHYFLWQNKKNKVTEKVQFIYQKYLAYLLNPELISNYTPREYWEHLKNQYSDGPTIDVSECLWSYSVLTHIGKCLYDILVRNIAFNANAVRHKHPSKFMSQAFYTVYETKDIKLYKQIRAHPLLCKLYRDAKLDYLEFNVNVVPMLSPPRPWVKYDFGGLLVTKVPFIRFPDHAMHQLNYYSKVPTQQLNPCFDSLNSLSLCPWIINKPLLDIVIQVFRNGGSEELDIPLNPSSFAPPLEIKHGMSKKEKALIKKQNMELEKKKGEVTSLWFDCLYKLSIANHFQEKVFWFPHNLDFRGRVYPTPPHFNHLGSDMARSILLFAEGQPLGKKGLEWLKIHLINLTGFKKRDTHEERLKFADQMIPEILDSAIRPFEGNQWWKTSDKPWQTLACCKELANALRLPQPEEYVSHFPVHQDGSCNGLQHYAALGRDELGAIEVNLHPSNSPQDVYSGVAALVEKERQKDAADGVEIAKLLEGFVKRKVVKQTVMTFVYGVTAYGAKLQILKQLKDIPEFPSQYYHEAATYLRKKTFFSIREMFTATKEIQDWFTECAEQITRVSGDTLEWVTPLGLPVIQPYFKETSVRNSKNCISQGKGSEIHYNSKYEPYALPNIRKQKNAFAPNFIHSLDSTHMMLTSLFCQRKGITYVSVHDCYWTHASTVEIMNKICREQFVALHKEPILENLSSFFLEKYAYVADKNIHEKQSKEKSAKLKLRDVLMRVPEKGAFDLDKVLDSVYFFS